jgi:hypothetical protein
MKTSDRLAASYEALRLIGERKARFGLGMTRPEYAKLEREEAALKAEVRRLLDAEAP